MVKDNSTIEPSKSKMVTSDEVENEGHKEHQTNGNVIPSLDSDKENGRERGNGLAKKFNVRVNILSGQNPLQNICTFAKKRKFKESFDEAGTTSARPSVSSNDMATEDNKKIKKKKNGCDTCHKKVGLTGFDCRCGGLYCAIHRYSDKHNCTFNYRELGAQEIRRNNPVVVGEKIRKI